MQTLKLSWKTVLRPINLLSNQLADINGRIMAAGQSGQSPNSIYDLRDKAVTDLSKLTDLTVSYSGRGVVSVKLGSSGVGPTIVDGKQCNHDRHTQN